MRKINIVVHCDECDKEIGYEESYINVEVYGRVFCVDCFRTLSAFDLVKRLDLSDIGYMNEKSFPFKTPLRDIPILGKNIKDVAIFGRK